MLVVDDRKSARQPHTTDNRLTHPRRCAGHAMAYLDSHPEASGL
jgi:hypothetical protein